jgi:DsbC/DsbD-like thiol-disulfide interchange protein
MRVGPAIGLLLALGGWACGGQPAATPAAGAAEIGSAPTPGAAPAPATGELVRAALIASEDRVTAGRPMVVAIVLSVAPGHHVYWINPGESGLATEVDFSAPAGFRLGPPRFPGPVRFAGTGGVVSYGYQGTFAVSSEVVPPASLPSGPLALAARVDYLACTADACIPGEVDASLALEAATAARPARPIDHEALAAHRAALPVPLASLAGGRAMWRAEAGGARVLALSAPGGAPSYFPSAAETPRIAGERATGPGQLEVRYSPGAALAAAGLLAVTSAVGTRYYQLALAPGGTP